MNYDKIDLLALRATDDKGGLDRHKFAELIIRECCKVSDEIEPLELLWKTSRFVKLHFGIEE